MGLFMKNIPRPKPFGYADILMFDYMQSMKVTEGDGK